MTAAVNDTDCLIIGAGIAGASLAYYLAPHLRVILLEREPQPGYHSTGRSAAMFIESYGPPQIRALTRASRRFYDHPPAGFSDLPLLTPRACLYVATDPAEASLLDEHARVLLESNASPQRLDRHAARALVPVLSEARLIGAVMDGDSADIDVNALHQGFLRGLRHAGGSVICGAEVTAIDRAASVWQVRAGDSQFRAPLLVDAAGAWADVVAGLAGVTPIGLEPCRRSAFTFAPPDTVQTAAWPMVIGAAEDWYLKPVGPVLLASPANADPTTPQDVQAEDWDIALAIDRIETATTLTIGRPSSIWAGLRSFVADGELVAGFDDRAPGFFWLAAQGGYGIQTAPATGEACAALIRGLELPAWMTSFGLTATALAPARLR